MMKKLEYVQYSVVLAVTGTWKSTSREKLYNELGWESLNLRPDIGANVLFYFARLLTTSQPIPPLPQSNYCLRRPATIGQVRLRTMSFVASFYPNCLLEWNKLDLEIRQLPTLSTFEKKLFSLIRPLPQPVYSIHDPKGLVIPTQFRVGLSKLNLHKFMHDFKDTANPMCSINDGIANTDHFLLLCHGNDVQRKDLLDALNSTLRPQGLSNISNEALLEILLYGDETLPLMSMTLKLELSIYTQQNALIEAMLCFLQHTSSVLSA